MGAQTDSEHANVTGFAVRVRLILGIMNPGTNTSRRGIISIGGRGLGDLALDSFHVTL